MWTAHCQNLVFIALVFLPSVARGIRDYSGLPPGPYCASRYPVGKCCAGRQDDCSAPVHYITTTYCYCDDFCEQDRRDEEDCCLDYWSHCKNITDKPLPLIGCFYQGKVYYYRQELKDNCNTCKCTSVNDRAEVLCEENRCLIEEELINEINSQGFTLGWQPGNYSKFWGKTLREGVEQRLGTLTDPSQPVQAYKMANPVRRIYNPDALPRKFDSRTHWPSEYISPIHDQGWCNASWAVSTADVASDRFAIMSNGTDNVDLSAQHLLSCNNRRQQGCRGGYLDRAWVYMRKFGLVNEKCYPWTGTNDKCTLRKKIDLNADCRNLSNSRRTELYKVGPAYRLGNETDIMQEILTSGPVQAIMRVYQDFFVYKSGVYKHLRSAESYDSGYHSVRILGWGEEPSYRGPPIKYWLVANSWGSDWGQNGLFKILRGSNECEIESFVLAVWAKTV